MPIIAIIAIIAGGLLAAIGIAGFVATGRTQFTALIPLALGNLLVLMGALTLAQPAWRKHAMHVAATVALLGVLGSAGGIMKLVRWLAGTVPEHPIAVLAQSGTSVVCAIFLAFAVRSFIAARRARMAAPAA
jgi:amino acid permease